MAGALQAPRRCASVMPAVSRGLATVGLDGMRCRAILAAGAAAERFARRAATRQAQEEIRDRTRSSEQDRATAGTAAAVAPSPAATRPTPS